MQKRNACANDIKNIVRNIMHSDMSSGKKLNELNDLEMSISSLLNANSKISHELSPLNQEITESKFKIRIKDPEKLKQKIDEYRTSVKEELKFFVKSEMKTLVKLNTYFDKYDMDCRFDFYDNDGNVSFENGVKMRAAGADIFVGGTSSIFSKEGTIAENIVRFRKCVEEA